eukprot:6010980-Prymnesium_polylepis.1
MTLRGLALRLEFYCLFFLVFAPPRRHHQHHDGEVTVGSLGKSEIFEVAPPLAPQSANGVSRAGAVAPATLRPRGCLPGLAAGVELGRLGATCRR